MRVFTTSFVHVHNTVNWQRSCTFSAVESEIPAFAAIITAIDSKNTSPVNMEGCVREVFSEHAVLGKIMIEKKERKTNEEITCEFSNILPITLNTLLVLCCLFSFLSCNHIMGSYSSC